MAGKKLYTALAAQFEDVNAFFRGLDQHCTAVLLVGAAAGQALGLQGIHNAAHGGRAYLLRPGQLIERERPAKNQDGERRELRRADSCRRVLPAHQAEKVDRRRVQPVRQGFDCGLPGHPLARLIILLTKVKETNFN